MCQVLSNSKGASELSCWTPSVRFHPLDIRSRAALRMAECDTRKHHPHDAQRALASVPGDARQRVQAGPAFRLDHARDCRHRAGEIGLRGNYDMLPAKRSAIAERIGEMPDVAL